MPVAGLALLLAAPELDVMYHHDPMHFWIVLLAALLNVGLGLLTSEIARRQSDARLFLVSMALLTGAAFLGLHALATPGILLPGSNKGFVVANPVGLLLASGFAAASALDLGAWAPGPRSQTWIKVGLGVVVAAWAVVSLTGLPPLGKSVPSQQLPEGLQLLGIPALALYGFAAVRYGWLYRQKRRTLLLAVAVAYVLLAEAMIAVVFSDTWHAAWWEWHVLMVTAFATIAIGARNEYRHARSLPGAFGGLYLDSTLDRIDRRRADALAALVAALRAQQPLTPILDRLRREWATTEEVALLERAAHQLYRTDELFRPYISPQLAEGLEERPELASLGGEERQVSVLFADLVGLHRLLRSAPGRRGDHDAEHLLGCHGPDRGRAGRRRDRAVRRRRHHGRVQRGRRSARPRRCARRGPRSGCATRSCSVARDQPGWPRFRIGVNTGPAVVGHVGAARMRSFTAIGDTTNLSARLQAQARPGHIVISRADVGGDRRRAPRCGRSACSS